MLNVRRGGPIDTPKGFKSWETLIDSLKEDTTYRFLGAPERLLQEEKLALQCTSKPYLQRLSVIWSSPLSDTNRGKASNQLAMPVWSQNWCLTDLRDIDRQARKIMCESGGKHPLGLKATVYLPRALGGGGMRSVEEEYKMIKIKSAIKLYSNEDSTMRLVRAFEENAVHRGHQSLVKETRMFAEELGFTLDLSFPHPKCRDNTDGADVPRDKIKRHLKKAAMEQRKTEAKEKKWQEKLLAASWEEDQLNQRGCFAWLKNWDTASTHIIAEILERYEQLTLKKVYHARNTQTSHPNDTLCRLCGKTAESIPHVLASCSALSQNKFLARYNAALKVLFREMLRELQLSDSATVVFSGRPKTYLRVTRCPSILGYTSLCSK